MKYFSKKLTLTIFLLLFCLTVNGQEKGLVKIPIEDVLNNYSTREGINFVVDPRVKGNFYFINVDVDKLTQRNLVNILWSLNFSVLEKDDLVYVVPTNVQKTFEEASWKKWVTD